MIPVVIDNTGHRERAYDIYSLLLKERIVFVGAEINDQLANLVIAQLLYLNSEDPEREIQMFINSPGGAVYAGLAIYDTMRQISAPVRTVAVGLTASFGTILLVAGTSGHRYALRNATIHMHQPWGGAQGQATDIEIQAREVLRLRQRVESIMEEHTGQPVSKLHTDMERDRYLSAAEALDYGLVDKIIEHAHISDVNNKETHR